MNNTGSVLDKNLVPVVRANPESTVVDVYYPDPKDPNGYVVFVTPDGHATKYLAYRAYIGAITFEAEGYTLNRLDVPASPELVAGAFGYNGYV